MREHFDYFMRIRNMTRESIRNAARQVTGGGDEFEVWRRIAKIIVAIAVDSDSKVSEKLLAARFLGHSSGVAPCRYCGR